MSSKVIKHEGNTWTGVAPKEYKGDSPASFCGVKRHELLGRENSELNFETRFFELEPGGYSSLEYHQHPHTVIVIQGKGRVVLEDSITDIALHDVVYVAPEAIHQFLADGQQGLGFICIVDRDRDKPIRPGSEELNRRITDKSVLQAIQR